MKHILLSALLVFFLSRLFAQSTPTIVAYFDTSWREVSKEDAAFYRTVENAQGKYLVKDYYMSGQLQMQALCTAYKPKLIWEGNTVLYHENGKVSEEGPFRNEDRFGFHKYWYEDGTKKKEVFHKEKEEVVLYQ